MIWLLSALGWLRKAAEAVWSFCTRHPWQAALIASVALNVWLWRGWDRAEQKLADRIAAGDRAEAEQKRVNQQVKTTSQGAAKDGQARHTALSDRVERASRDHIARLRLWPTGSTSQGDPTTEAGRAQVLADAAEAAKLAAQLESDILVCGANHAYAVSAHEWAKDLVAKGLAEPAAE
jgi:hypothetical protein